MARSGSFGTSLNPFGTGSFGGLAQYDIGDSLKDLEAYRLEIAWGNGDITDEEYAASLAKLVAAATPGTQALLSAQNKLEDVTYRIGRSQAEAQGPDALIAFDQQALAGMNPGNLRYRDVKSSLDAQLANRRSRDYGLIVDAYNRGETSTESLLEWVENTQASLPSDAPDRDNWASVQANLVERVVSEKDAQVYQDYQDKKLSGADFVAYLTGRRDAYSMDSPKWVEADRRLADAVKNVKDTANAKADQEFFNLYSQGKKSDASYLLYVKRRIDAMDPSDPQLPEWKHKLSQAAHSIAEDQLRHAVTTATTAAGDAKARKNLRDFYVAYSKTLNPGSAEFRQTEESILALIRPAAGGSGGGGGGGGSAGGGGGGGVVEVHKGVPKIIPTTGGFDYIATLLRPSARENKKAQGIAVEILALNLSNAKKAENDAVWLYHDPRYPGQTVAERDKYGVLVKRDAQGNRVERGGKQSYVPGSSYRASSSDEIAALQMLTADYSDDLASVAAARGDRKAYWDAIDDGNDARDSARTTQAHAIQRDATTELKALEDGVELHTKLNDPATVVALLLQQAAVIKGAMDAGALDLEQRETWRKRGEALESNPMFPDLETDISGDPVYNRDGTRNQVGGMVDLKTGAYVPGVHFMLDTDSKGEEKWGPVRIDPAYEEDWATTHVTVQTGALGVRVVGEVQVSNGPSINIIVTTTDGAKKEIPWGGPVAYISYRDGYNNLVSGYSIDGMRTWIHAAGVQGKPKLELSGAMTYTENADGSATITDGNGNKMFALGPEGWTAGDGLAGAMQVNAVGWFGQAGPPTRGGVGVPGQQFRIVTAVTGPNGGPALNFVPREILYTEITAANVGAVARRTVATGAAAGASLAEESAAIRARGLGGPAMIPYADEDAARRQRRDDIRARDKRNADATARLQLGDTLADETNDIAARSSPTTQIVNTATGFTTGASSLAGIISLGSALINVTAPPKNLPPISPYVGFTLPTVPVYTGPLGRTPAPLPVALPRPTPVTPPLVVARGATPTPSGTEARIYEPEPAPVVKPKAPVPVYTGPLGR